MPRRAIALHNQSVAIEADDRDPRAAAILDFVCGALQGAPLEGAGHEVLLRAEGGDAERAEDLMRELAVRLVTDYASGLALHASALAVNGRAIIFPAVSGAGKSTLAVHLATRGLGFLTDELVLVPDDDGLVHPCARPAHLKPGSMFVVEQAGLASDPRVWTYAQGALVAPAVLGTVRAAPHPLGAIVFPERRPEGTGQLESLSSGRASFMLLGALVNARNLPQLGVAAAARLAASAPCYRAVYRDLGELQAQLAEVVAR